MKRFLFVLALLALVAAACGDDDTTTVAGDVDDDNGDIDEPAVSDAVEGPAEGVEYWSVEVTEDGRARPLVPSTVISLRFQDGNVGASLGCNSLGGAFEIVDGALVVDELAQTEMGCDPERHAQDEWFATVLTSRPAIDVDGDTLTLQTGTTTVVLRERSSIDPDRELEQARWVVTGFVEGEVAMSTGGEAEGWIFFDRASSTAEGVDGCNPFQASYEIDGSDVRFGPVESDAALCEDADFQERMRAVLGERVAWEIDHDQLTLRAPDGRGVTFRAADD